MRRLALLLLALTALAAVGAQLALPPYVAGRAEDRLTAGGGEAEVDVDALPAVRLIAGDGDRLDVRGEKLAVDLRAREERVLDRLDGFGEVRIVLTSLDAAPFRVERLDLTRTGDGAPYRLQATATVTPAELGAYAGAQFGGALGSFLGGLAARATGVGSEPIPVELDAQLVSADGSARADDTVETEAPAPTGDETVELPRERVEGATRRAVGD